MAALWSDPAATGPRCAAAAEAYAEPAPALVEALAAHGIAAHGRSGLNVWVPVREEAATVAHLAAAGWAVRAGERYRMQSPPADPHHGLHARPRGRPCASPRTWPESQRARRRAPRPPEPPGLCA